MYIYMYIYIYTCIWYRTYIYVCIYTYVCICMCVCPYDDQAQSASTEDASVEALCHHFFGRNVELYTYSMAELCCATFGSSVTSTGCRGSHLEASTLHQVTQWSLAIHIHIYICCPYDDQAQSASTEDASVEALCYHFFGRMAQLCCATFSSPLWHNFFVNVICIHTICIYIYICM